MKHEMKLNNKPFEKIKKRNKNDRIEIKWWKKTTIKSKWFYRIY